MNFVCKVENKTHSLAICDAGKLYFWFTGEEPENCETRFQNEFIVYLYLHNEIAYLITDQNIIYACNISGKNCTTSLYERDVSKLLFPTIDKIEYLQIKNNIMHIKAGEKIYVMKKLLFYKLAGCNMLFPELLQSSHD